MHREPTERLSPQPPHREAKVGWWDFSFRPGHHLPNRHYGPATARYPNARTLTSSSPPGPQCLSTPKRRRETGEQVHAATKRIVTTENMSQRPRSKRQRRQGARRGKCHSRWADPHPQRKPNAAAEATTEACLPWQQWKPARVPRRHCGEELPA